MTTVSPLAPGMPEASTQVFRAFHSEPLVFLLLPVSVWEAAHARTKMLIIFHVFSYRSTLGLSTHEIQRDVLHATGGGFLIPS